MYKVPIMECYAGAHWINTSIDLLGDELLPSSSNLRMRLLNSSSLLVVIRSKHVHSLQLQTVCAFKKHPGVLDGAVLYKTL